MTRPNLLTIISRAAESAMARRDMGYIPCLADPLAMALVDMSASEIEHTLREWIVASGRPRATPFVALRGDVARHWLAGGA